MQRWRETLMQLIPRLRPALNDPETRWALIGSAATALHGCAVEPRDLDFLAVSPQGVRRFLELLAEFLPETCPHGVDHPDWLSSVAHPMSDGPDEYGFTWHFARWRLQDVKVEVAHISPPAGFRTSAEGRGIWEAGPEIWPHIVTVPFGSLSIPVVPLELQLGTSMQRGLEDRVQAVIAVLQHGYDGGLLHRALTADQLARFQALAGTVENRSTSS